jgi:CAAX prenyl protease-like protein
MNRLLQRYPSLPYVAPFAAFMLLLVLAPRLPVEPRVEGILRVSLLLAVLWVFSRRVIEWRAPNWLSSILLGVAVFLLWIAPDVIFPTWRGHWLFANGLTGRAEGTMPVEGRSDPLVLILRAARAVVLVPIIEELFWRGWLPRWIDNMDDFRKVPLGSYSNLAFWVTAALFAVEHGSMWDVGLMAGLAYNWWMQRTRSLGDLMLTHAVTNACLSAYVVIEGRWEYW